MSSRVPDGVRGEGEPLVALGLDLSLSSSGLVVASWGRVLAWSNPKTKPEEVMPARWQKVRREACRLYRDWKPDVVVLEGGARGGKFVDLNIYRLAGVVEYALWVRDAPFISCAPTQLKAWAVQDGRADKKKMLDAARRLWPECPNTDCADGFWLSQWGIEHHDEFVGPA